MIVNYLVICLYIALHFITYKKGHLRIKKSELLETSSFLSWTFGISDPYEDHNDVDQNIEDSEQSEFEDTVENMVKRELNT